MKTSISLVCDAVVKWCLYATLFLTPIFFLPFTLYPVDLNKQVIFVSLTLIATLAWLIQSIGKGTIEYPKNTAGIPLVLLIAFVSISAFFSGARGISFMGISGGETDTALALVSFALFYFLISVSFREKEDYTIAFIACMASASLAVLYAVLQAVGVSLLPWDFTKGGDFNAVGTANAFGLYAGMMGLLAFAVAYYMPVTKRMRIGSGILAAVSFILAFLIGYFAIFIALILGISIFMARDARRNFAPLALIALSVFMLVLASGIISVPVPRIATPAEVAPSIRASLSIAKETAREGVQSFLLGSGPATYQYQYGKYHDAALNQTIFWNIQFTQGFNAVLTHLVSWGFLGTAFFLLFLMGIVHTMLRMAQQWHADQRGVVLIALGAYSILTLFLYPQNFSLYFFLFALAGMITAFHAERNGGYGTLSFSSSRYGVFALPLGIMLMGMATIVLLYANGRRYVAGIQFARGMSVATRTKDIEQALPLLIRGVSLDSENDRYLTALASAYLARANALVATVTSASAPDADLQKKVGDAAGAAVASVERATRSNPLNVQNWIALGQVYEAVIPFNAQAASFAFAAYDKAASLQPNNPSIPLYSGNAHYAAAARMKTDNTKEYAAAQTAFDKALALKPDYAPAHFAVIRMLDGTGRGDEALARAERLRALITNDSNALLELGILHYQAGRAEKAQEVLEQTVRVSPDYANALYFLGLTYEKLGDRARALTQFERVLKLNPENAEMKVIVDNVRAGRQAIDSGKTPAPFPEKK